MVAAKQHKECDSSNYCKRCADYGRRSYAESLAYSQSACRFKLSSCIEKQLGLPYPNVSRIFSRLEGRTLEKYHIAQKVERVKELLQGGEHTRHKGFSKLYAIDRYAGLFKSRLHSSDTVAAHTLEKYHIAQKVERVKELLQGGEHTLEEIADMAPHGRKLSQNQGREVLLRAGSFRRARAVAA